MKPLSNLLAASVIPRTVFFQAVIPLLPGDSAGKEIACSAGDPGSIPGLGRSPGEGNSYPLQYPGLENPMDSQNPLDRRVSKVTFTSIPLLAANTQPLPIPLRLSFIPRPDTLKMQTQRHPPPFILQRLQTASITDTVLKKKRIEHKRPFRMQLKLPVQPHPLSLLSRLYFHCI